MGACASGEAIQASSGELDGGASVGGKSAGGGTGGHSGSLATGGASSGGSGGKGSSGSAGTWYGDGGGTGGSAGTWPTAGSGGGDASGGSGGSATGSTGGGGSGGGTSGAGGGGGTSGAGGSGGTSGAGGSGGTSGCTPPLVDCGGTCVDTSTNPQHCNACNNACGAAPNSTASCAGGVCSYACNAGFVQVGSKCTTFGGAFAGPGPGCGSAACYAGNPYSAGCGCPANFAPIGPIDWLDDRACPNNNPPFGWQSAYVCIGGAWSAAADFGGAYHRQGANCVDGNPFTGGACSCPAPSIAIETIADGGCWSDTHFGVCWNPSATLSTFGGAYQKRDNAACVVGNPAMGGACSCPAGTTEISIRNIYGPGNANCTSGGAMGGHINICRAL